MVRVAFDIPRARLLKVMRTQALMTRIGIASNAGARFRLPQVRAPFPSCTGCSYSCRSATKNALAFPQLGGVPPPGGPRRPVGNGMLYLAYQLQTDIMEPIRSWAGK